MYSYNSVCVCVPVELFQDLPQQELFPRYFQSTGNSIYSLILFSLCVPNEGERGELGVSSSKPPLLLHWVAPTGCL